LNSVNRRETFGTPGGPVKLADWSWLCKSKQGHCRSVNQESGDLDLRGSSTKAPPRRECLIQNIKRPGVVRPSTPGEL